MKKILTGIMIMSLMACATKVPFVKSMDEIEYILPVQKVKLSNQTELAYIEEGTGNQTIIFIHGLGSYLSAWNKNFTELSKDYHCIAIDLPGYGKSSKGNYAYSMSYYAGVIKELIDKKGLKNVVLAGHSMGGQIALTTALMYPNSVSKLILVDPAGFETFNKGQKDWLRNVMVPDLVKYTTAEQIRTNLAVNFYNMPSDAEFMINDRMAIRGADDFDAYCYAVSQSVKGMVDQPVYEFLPQIKQTTLTFFGAEDNLIPNRFLNGGKTEKYATDGNSRLPNSKLVMLEKTGHFAQFEKADQVNAEIKEFLK